MEADWSGAETMQTARDKMDNKAVPSLSEGKEDNPQLLGCGEKRVKEKKCLEVPLMPCDSSFLGWDL